MKGCLLIHGYTGAPFEVEPLAKHLESLGYQTLCPTLHGHTGTRKDLKKSKYTDWIESAEEGYMNLSRTCDEVAALGFSMGGLLAFNVAIKHNVKCLVTMGTPIYCFDTKNLYMDIRENFNSKNINRIKEYAGACFTPIRANLNFQRILHKSKPILKDIDIPIFVVHGNKDPIAHKKSAYYIYNKVKSSEKQIKLYDNLPHRFQYCNNQAAIFADIGDFVKKHLQ